MVSYKKIKKSVIMAHTHGHTHLQTMNNRFLYGILLNVIFIIVEIICGVMANSVALIADAIHNIGDVFGLFIAWLGYWLAHKKAPQKFTYGFKNATIIAAFLNAILLFVAVGGISWEAIKRLGQTESIASGIIILVAAAGVAINGLTAYLFFHDRKKDINIKGAFLHMVLDAAVSVGVIIAGLLIFWTSWAWIDPVISLMIGAVILISSWQLFRESLDLMLMAVPTSINLYQLKKDIKNVPGVITYHDLHIWPLSTTEAALSVHLVVQPTCFIDSFSETITEKIKTQHGISHVTIQLETEGGGKPCKVDCV